MKSITILLILSIITGALSVYAGVANLPTSDQDHFSTLFAIFITGLFVSHSNSEE